MEDQVKAKLAEEMAEQVIEDVDEILYTREDGETINERGIDIGLAQGRQEGIEIGYKQGYEKGKEEEEKLRNSPSSAECRALVSAELGGGWE